MSKKIFNDGSRMEERFQGGLNIEYLDTPSILNEKSNINRLSTSIIRCCSSVKNTTSNWYYYLKNYSIEENSLFSKWIEEITPIFPSLKIKVIDLDKSQVKVSTDQSSNRSIINISDWDSNNELISIKFKYSQQSGEIYHVTSIKSATHGYFSNFMFLINGFLLYNIKNKTIVTNENYKYLCLKYVQDNMDTIIIPELTTGVANARNIKNNTRDSNMFFINLTNIIDKKDITQDKITNYLIRVIEVNLLDIINYTKKGVEDKIDPTKLKFLQVLYTNKSYILESYLAHNLIRAGLSPEFNVFIEQYFLIKESTPDLDFWNRLLLTQYGFKFYYYYWLTNERQFKIINPTDFNKALIAWQYYSTKSFFAQFVSHFPEKQRVMFDDLYNAGKFQECIELLTPSILLSLKKEKKDKFKNLRFQ